VNAKEVSDAIKTLCGLFMGQVSDESVLQLRKDFAPFSRQAVFRAIAEHRKSPSLKNGYWNYGQLIELCNRTERGEQLEARQFVPAQTFAAIYRQQRPDLAKAGDFEVIIRVHRSWWRAVCIRGRFHDGYRRHFFASCVTALINAGMTERDAETWAAYPFLDEGPTTLQHWLNEVRSVTSHKPETNPAIL
jgi:hypothetical protein